MSAPPRPSLQPEIGPDGIVRDSPVIAYTEKIIEEEQLQLKKYIQENYSKIRDVERELEGLTLELKLTAGPKKAALEHIRKKVEQQTEKIRLAKLKEDQAKKVWEAAVQAVKDEEAIKQKLCDDLNRLVQENANTQYARLEELKRRLEALNPSRISSSSLINENGGKSTKMQSNPTLLEPVVHPVIDTSTQVTDSRNGTANASNESTADGNKQVQQANATEKKRTTNPGRGKGGAIVLKGRGSSGSSWTGAGFDT